jgi:chromosome segregation ATPase
MIPRRHRRRAAGPEAAATAGALRDNPSPAAPSTRDAFWCIRASSMSAPAKPIPHANEGLLARIASLESALAAARAQVEALTAERDQLRASHERLRQDLELFRRRIYVAQAERVDTRQLEIEFAEKLAELTKIERRLDEELAAEAAEASAPAGNDGKRSKSRVKPTGRRDLQETSLPKASAALRN